MRSELNSETLMRWKTITETLVIRLIAKKQTDEQTTAWAEWYSSFRNAHA